MNDISLIALLSFATLFPFLVASGTCFVKFSIVFVLIRNALGVQQVPSNMTLNGIALLLSVFVMMPVGQQAYDYYKTENVKLESVEAVVNFMDGGLSGYRAYLKKYSDPELVDFFQKAQAGRLGEAKKNTQKIAEPESEPAIIALLPAYALTEIKEAFKIGFYLYLPFIVVDLVISSILLSLGMMMMSPVTISVPVKLILFVAMDGWTLLVKGLVMQYIDLAA
ncbi:EscR/YscR/HrcR family type III secretion system export apparatus protein [Iodobacter fluviatilis]|uniref:Flagellar biosynthetic protein fliP n=1 Tax=Iodobacter fluviatilis TaxID=537 RepID=A0A377Q5V2_9NEIS|nr:EscR/YscR/HrcR family type III secretion system export apparatus protein [Iodobacter fluviatilis]TCU80249.1 type III secretion protein R [Iodobacter fluviatilis]STQ90138.1 Flagellar biosynthetic protein fliP precursor [Iodobacter fluviatilis]